MTDKSFRDKTKEAIDWASGWLLENADSLADTFAGGGMHWEINLAWSTATDTHDGIPRITFSAEKVPPSEIAEDWWPSANV